LGFYERGYRPPDQIVSLKKLEKKNEKPKKGGREKMRKLQGKGKGKGGIQIFLPSRHFVSLRQ